MGQANDELQSAPSVGRSPQVAGTDADRCPACGADLDAEAVGAGDALGPTTRLCLRCGTLVPHGERAADPGTYEEKTASCLPFELEQLARAEAVDGWYLVDTTASSAVTGQIDVHFRRPVRAGAPESTADAPESRAAEEDASTKTARATGKRRLPSTRPRRPPPKPGEGPPDPSPETAAAGTSRSAVPAPGDEMARLWGGIVAGLVVLGVAAFIVDQVGVLGLIVAMMFLPRLLRALKGDDRRRR